MGSLELAAAMAAAGAVLAAGAALRPPPARVTAVVTGVGDPAAGRRGVRARGIRAAARVVEPLGRRLRMLAGRPSSAAADRRWGWSVAAAVLLVPLSVPMAVAGASAPAVVDVLARRRRRRSQETAARSTLPEAVDLLRMAVEAGLTPTLALAETAPRVGPPIGPALSAVLREVHVGRSLADALTTLTARVGEPVRPLVTALVSALADGAPLAPPLERLAQKVRQDRRRRAEEAARRLPVKLLFPLVCCALPAFGLLTIVPLVAGALSSLRL